MREVEVKFRVDPDFDLPDLAADGALPALDGRRVAARRQGRFTLRATYYDTEDLRLARAGITLRRRTGGTDEGWHLKLPTGQEGVREEITWTPATGRTPPAQLLDLVAARVRQAPVHAVATVVTTRTSVLLSDGNSAVLAEVADDAVRVMDGNRVSARFREVEVEDLGGGTDVLAAVGRVLEAAGAVPGGTDSKLARALGARAQAPADPPPPPQAGRDKPAGLAVTAYLRHHVARLLAEDPRLRLGLDDAVHQVRVATRRLRGGLRTFGPLLDPDWAQPVRDELGWLAGELGPARDLEVLRARLLHEIDLLPEDVVRGNARARVERALGADLETALDRAREALRSTRYLDLVDRLVEGAAAPPLTDAARRPARVVLPPLVRRTWQRMARRVAQAEAGQGDPVAYHNVRIAAKRARYAAEAVAPALGKPPTRFARRCEAVQDHLGEHQDAVVAGRTLLDLAERRGMGTAASFTLGVLFAREQQTATRLRQDFPPLWRDVSRRRYRRWFEDA